MLDISFRGRWLFPCLGILLGLALRTSAANVAGTQEVALVSENVLIATGTSGSGTYKECRKAMHMLPRTLSSNEVCFIFSFLRQPTRMDPSAPMRLMERNAIKNDLLDTIFAQPVWPNDLLLQIREMHADAAMDSIWKDYCFQHIGKYAEEVSAQNTPTNAAQRKKEALEMLQTAVTQSDGQDAGRALMALEHLALRGEFNRKWVEAEAIRMALSGTNCDISMRMAGLQTAANLGSDKVLPVARNLCVPGYPGPLRLTAISTLGVVGKKSDLPMLGYRYYSSALGRWFNRDPKGERGSLALYGFCGNSSIMAIDSLGQSWSIVRNGNASALAYKGRESDTIEDLARVIHLDPHESSKWLKPHAGLFGTSSCWFDIPNTVYVFRGETEPDTLEWIRAFWDAATWSISNYKVLLRDQVTRQIVIDAFKDKNIYAFSYYGHGPRIVPVGPSLGLSDVSALIPYGLAQLHLQSCWSFYDHSASWPVGVDGIDWPLVVSPLGEFGGYNNDTTPGGNVLFWRTTSGTHKPTP